MSSLMHHITIIARDVVLAIVPLALLFLLFQVFLLKLPLREVAAVLKGTLIASFGLFLFLLGVGLAFLPFGRAIGMALASLDRSWPLLTMGALLGF